MKIEIYGKLPSLNDYIEACRRNPHAGAKMKKEVEQVIMIQLCRMKPISGKVFITFLWHERTARRDPDNVEFGKKFILDAMQRANKLPNDNAHYIAGFTDLFDYGKPYGVSITIEAVSE
jgi:Holliday junction resolvase RusA-like endonuclease